MTRETLMATAEKLVAGCRTGDTSTGLDTLYAPDCVSVEAFPNPDTGSAETRGLDGIRAKHAWWEETFTLHDAKVEGPYPHGEDRFAVIFWMDVTEKETGERSQMQEVAVYHVNGSGKIAREEFFYTM